MKPKSMPSVVLRSDICRLAAVVNVVLLGQPMSPTAAQEANSAAPRLFELKVINSDGKPVPDVTVEIRGGLAGVAKPIKRGTFLTPSLAKTDDQGVLIVEVAKDPQYFAVCIKQSGFGPYWAEWNSQDHPEAIPEKFTAQLDAGWSVGGVVVDEDGNPVEGATVSPSIRFKKRPGDFDDLHTGDDIKVDAAGRWRFDCVPASMSEVFVTINHVDFMPARHTLTRSEFGLELGTEPSGKIELKRGVMIAGTVRDEGGKPIAGAAIRTKFLNELREATTDDDGTYFLAGCEPRMTRVVAQAKGRALELQEVRVEPGMGPVDFVMRPGGKVRLRVLDENDKPVPRARIFFQQWRGRIDYFEFDHVNQFADANGVWEWNEAPLDEFRADICRPNGMQLEEQPLVAREEEYIFRPPPLLVISGRVVDAKTKEPIKEFRLVPGNHWDNSQMFWSQREAYDAQGGTYEIKRDRGHTAHFVRIEANGYKASVSRAIKSDEGNVTIDFELEPTQNIAMALTTPEGAPAAGAKVALGVEGSQINVANGDIDDSSTYAARYTADEAGRISIPPPDSVFQLIITHPSGLGYSISTAEKKVPESIQLTTWARVEGTFRVGKEVASSVALELNSSSLPSHPDLGHMFVSDQTTTAHDGSFVFERVIPGPVRIGRRIVYMVDEGATEVASSKMVPLELRAGETARIELGGDGRPVTGSLSPPEGHTGEVPWSFARIQMTADGEPKSPPAPEAVQNDAERYQAWRREWLETDEGKAWRAAYRDYRKRREESPYFNVSVDRDGNFRIDDVPPGEYVLRVDLHERPIGRLVDYRFSVPEAEGEDASEPFDLGILTLEAVR